MFHPQPTPPSSSCFVPDLPPNGIGLALGFGIPPPPRARARRQAAAPASGLRYLYGSGSGSDSGSSCAGRTSTASNTSSISSTAPHLSAHHHSQLPHPHFHLAHHPPRLHQRPYAPAAMDDQASHDMAAQQEAAKDYQPVLEGPLVGDKTTSDAIAHKYAKADQVYVEKTVALRHTYSHYRPIQGDGNCGWRAIGFSYFEKLVESTDQAKVEGEVARIMSFNHQLSTFGGYTFFEDWVDLMTGLLRDLALVLDNTAAAHALLLQRWNDASVEGGLLYYLRLLAATYLKANADTYDPFVPDGQNVHSYCAQSIEPINREIEHLGIVALVNVLLTPVDFVLEIAYLDRSPGSQVNHHRFTDEMGVKETSLAGPTIFLLYCPDHYDILYRTPSSPDVLVNQISSMSHVVQIRPTGASLGAFSAMNLDPVGVIPGLSNVSPMTLPPTTASSVGGEAFLQAHQGSWSSFADDVGASAAQTLSRQTSAAPAQASTPPGAMGPVPSSLMTGGLGMDAQKRASLAQAAGAATTPVYPFRFTPLQLEYEENAFKVKTSTFKNSVWNRAHYGNPDFHPEEWSPEEDAGDGRAAGKKRGKERDS